MSGFIYDGLPDKEEDDEFVNRECYRFNKNLERLLDDSKCIHCRFYLTLECRHIEEFVDEDGEA